MPLLLHLGIRILGPQISVKLRIRRRRRGNKRIGCIQALLGHSRQGIALQRKTSPESARCLEDLFRYAGDLVITQVNVLKPGAPMQA
ncbi:hypothetical protein D3C78_1563100 [compost metagenome]